MRLLLYILTGFILIFGLLGSIKSYAQNEITVHTVIVSDNLRSTQNLIGGYDQDDADDRALALHWNFGDTEFVDIHIYIEDLLNDQHQYLGRTADGTATSFEWRAGKPNLNPEYADGPQFGESYRFIVFGLVYADSERQWLFTYNPVEFISSNSSAPTPIPETPEIPLPNANKLFVTDSLSTSEDLSGKWDHDESNEKALVLKWNLNEELTQRKQLQHLYIYTSEDQYQFVTSIDPSKNYFVWKKNNRDVASRFRGGPQYGESYRFVLFLSPTVALTHIAPVNYVQEIQIPTPTATPTLIPTPSQINGQPIPFTKTFDLPGLADDVVPLQMVWIPPGTFTRGSPNNESPRGNHEGPQHEVTISHGFYLGKFELTNAQYRTYSPNHHPKDHQGISIDGEDQPVTNISWGDAVAYTKWLTEQSDELVFRLPTEAEWEYACRGNTFTSRYWGNDETNFEARLYANTANHPDILESNYLSQFKVDEHYFYDDGYGLTAPVGSFLPNPFGLHDMLGNVFEWCYDYFSYTEYTEEPRIDPIGPKTGTQRIIKGGSWFTGPGHIRAAVRISRRPFMEEDQIGVRIAASFKSQNPLPEPTSTSTYTPSATKTQTPMQTIRPVETETPTESPTAVPTLPPTFTPTPTVTATATYTPTPQPTLDPNQPPQEITIDLPGLPEGAVPLQLVWIPPGKFMMGSPEDEVGRQDDEGPHHEVTISEGFYMGKYEVTQNQWQTVMGDNPSIFSDKPNNPVEQLSWNDCQSFFETINNKDTSEFIFRLPTEAEWEFACRANTTSRFSHGDALVCNEFCEPCSIHVQYMWYCGNNNPYGTKEVGLKLPNIWGLFDMYGNVWEWCADRYDIYSSESVTDPIGGASSHRVIRGGAWFDYFKDSRSAKRSHRYPDYTSFNLGFRVAASIINSTN